MARYRSQVDIARPLHKYLSSSMCNRSVVVARLSLAWVDVVGEELSARCAPVEIRHRRLIVATTSHPWAQELNMQRIRLYEKVTQTIPTPAFEELRFCVDAPFVERIVHARIGLASSSMTSTCRRVERKSMQQSTTSPSLLPPQFFYAQASSEKSSRDSKIESVAETNPYQMSCQTS